MTSMRAVVQTGFGGPEALEVRQVERPEPVPTEVLVRVHAAGVNPVDAKTRLGRGMSRVMGDPPFIPGWDVAGVVEEVGWGVTRFAPGDEVFGLPWFPRRAGAYAEYVTAPSRQLASQPAALDHRHAAAVPLGGLTSWQALVDTARVQAGQSVLVHAASGGVGHLAVQIAKARGAYVLGTARAEKHDFLRELGVDEPIDYTEVPFEEVAHDVDVVMDLVGTEDYGLRSLRTLRPGGLLLPIASSDIDNVMRAAEEQGKSVRDFLVEPDGHAMEQLAAMIDAGMLRPQLEEVLPLAEAGRAHDLVERGRARGKVVLDAVA
jgi:NADPH:quinone reductase-like Zn-dependent oxidoreductase